MSKILISARDLKIGGIEKSLVTLINYLIDCDNNITLVLEKKEGELLEEINTKVNIVEYTPNKRKIFNILKRIRFILKYAKRYDVSISYATYLKSGSFVSRMASKNSILWCHADYLCLYNNEKEKMKNFFEDIHYDKFTKIVFVAKSAQKSFLEVFPDKKNTFYCNNLIDYNKIYKCAEEKIKIKPNAQVCFLNIGRHDEKQKRLTRIIMAALKLKQDNLNFQIIFVGDGKDTKKYKELVKKNGLEKNILFEGKKVNPYPYFKIADCIVVSSDYEGYPVVFLESFLFNKPIISTKVSDFEDIQKGRGIVVNKNVDSIYCAMKKFIEEGYTVKNYFNAKEYNREIQGKIKKIMKKY